MKTLSPKCHTPTPHISHPPLVSSFKFPTSQHFLYHFNLRLGLTGPSAICMDLASNIQSPQRQRHLVRMVEKLKISDLHPQIHYSSQRNADDLHKFQHATGSLTLFSQY